MRIHVSYLLFVVSPCNSPKVCVSGETRQMGIHAHEILENVVDFG